MSQPAVTTEPGVPFKLNVRGVQLTEEQFARLCQENPDLRLEVTAQQELIIMAPTGLETGRRNSTLTQRLANWAEANGTGLTFDSSTLFTLPNGAKRSPDVSWIRHARWDALSDEQKDDFAPICPDFVTELRSRSDRLATLQEKMEEYLANGATLGWLIDPLEKKVHIYRPGTPAEVLDNPSEISGDPLLKGFVLKLDGILFE